MAQIIKNDELKPMQNISKMNFDENIVMFDLTNRKVKLNSREKIRSIGISNYYTKEAFDKVMSYATTTPSVIQNENHIFYQNNDLRDYVVKYGVVLESYFLFGGRGNTSESLNNDVIVDLSKKYNKHLLK